MKKLRALSLAGFSLPFPSWQPGFVFSDDLWSNYSHSAPLVLTNGFGVFFLRFFPFLLLYKEWYPRVHIFLGVCIWRPVVSVEHLFTVHLSIGKRVSHWTWSLCRLAAQEALRTLLSPFPQRHSYKQTCHAQLMWVVGIRLRLSGLSNKPFP